MPRGRPGGTSSVGPAAGRNTRNEAPPPSRSWTHARPPCSSANRRTSVSPTPTPGECWGASGPWRKGSNTMSRISAGTPGPLSSTAIVTPSGSGQTRTQIDAFEGCAARCWRAGSPRSARPSRRRSVGRPVEGRSPAANPRSGRSRPGRAGRGRRRRSTRAWEPRCRARAGRGRAGSSPCGPIGARSTAMRCARSFASSSSSWMSPRSKVIARPRIAASGVRRSCETACRNVFFISSSARRRWVASRSTSRARSSWASASLRSVTSSRNPCQ